MDDLDRQISQILSDPQSMQQLQSMAAALGLGGEAAQPQPEPQAAAGARSAPGAAGLSDILRAGQDPGLSPELLQTVGRIAPLLSQVTREDDSIRLLRALRPLLSQPRQQKLDEAVKILQMMRLLPLLKNSGMLGSFL